MSEVDGAVAEMLHLTRRMLYHRFGLRLDEVADRTLLSGLRQSTDESGATWPLGTISLLSGEGPTSDTFFEDLVRRVTIGETFFFRHAEDVRWLRESVLPQVIARRKAERRLRLWSAGCSTGQEVYSLAIMVRECLPDIDGWDIEILGTDINQAALRAAEGASYGPWELRGVDAETLQRWFEPAGADRWRPLSSLREMVRFGYLNLRDPIYPTLLTGTTDLDLILCRNVFIYFGTDFVREVVGRLGECLRPDGWLLCGPSDVLHITTPAGFRASSVRHPVHRLRPSPVEVRAESTASPAEGRSPMRQRQAPAPERQPVSTQCADRSAGHAELLDLVAAGRISDACAGVEARLRDEPLSAELWRILAMALGHRDRADAIAAWRKLLYIAPDDCEAHLNLALLLKQQGRMDESRRHCRAVLELLEAHDDRAAWPGRDRLPVSWVRDVCRILAAPKGGQRQ